MLKLCIFISILPPQLYTLYNPLITLCLYNLGWVSKSQKFTRILRNFENKVPTAETEITVLLFMTRLCLITKKIFFKIQLKHRYKITWEIIIYGRFI